MKRTLLFFLLSTLFLAMVVMTSVVALATIAPLQVGQPGYSLQQASEQSVAALTPVGWGKAAYLLTLLERRTTDLDRSLGNGQEITALDAVTAALKQGILGIAQAPAADWPALRTRLLKDIQWMQVVLAKFHTPGAAALSAWLPGLETAVNDLNQTPEQMLALLAPQDPTAQARESRRRRRGRPPCRCRPARGSISAPARPVRSTLSSPWMANTPKSNAWPATRTGATPEPRASAAPATARTNLKITTRPSAVCATPLPPGNRRHSTTPPWTPATARAVTTGTGPKTITRANARPAMKPAPGNRPISIMPPREPRTASHATAVPAVTGKGSVPPVTVPTPGSRPNSITQSPEPQTANPATTAPAAILAGSAPPATAPTPGVRPALTTAQPGPPTASPATTAPAAISAGSAPPAIRPVIGGRPLRPRRGWRDRLPVLPQPPQRPFRRTVFCLPFNQWLEGRQLRPRRSRCDRLPVLPQPPQRPF